MYLFEVTLNEAKASLRFMTTNYHANLSPQVSGDPRVLGEFSKWVTSVTGPFGHILTQPKIFVCDLDYALFSEDVPPQNKWYGEARLVSGDRGDWYHLDIPEGSMT